MNRIGHLLFICSLLWISVNSNFRGDEYSELKRITLGNFRSSFSYKNEKYDTHGQLSQKNCNSGFFQCEKTGKCILKDKLCDKIYDCFCEEDDKDCRSQVQDESDEDTKYCSNHEHNYRHFSCANDEFQCKHVRECIPEHMFCNGYFDCSDHSDEDLNCQKNLNCTGKFQCKNGYCTSKKWVCDGTNDCFDNSDEMNCDHYTLFSEAECTYANNRFLCKSKRCIPLEHVCNKNNDCGDWSDEHFNCNNTSCLLSTKCQHCTETSDGPKCYCPSGYKLNDTTCTDIDECQIYGICDQGCENLQGTYHCLCQPGYLLQNDKKTCKAQGGEATLLFATRNIIYGYHLDSQIKFNFLKNVDHVGNIAVNKDYLYWREWQDGTPELRKLDTRTHERETLLTTGLSGQALLAVDWITGNIYFVDYIYRHIGVCDDKGKYCTILAHNVKVSSFALLPVKGLMYYYEEGEAQNGKIQVREMDGNNKTVKTLIQKSFSMPFAYGLTIDYPNNRLYWMSAISNSTMRIQSAKLDGTDIRTVLDVPEYNNWHPNSLVVFENKLYWSNWDSKSIQSCNKFFGKNWDVLNHTNGATYYSIEIDHSVMQTSNISNPCQTNPCSQLCLLNRNNSYTCACSFEQELNTDQRTCKGEKKAEEIVIIAGNRIIHYTYELLGKFEVTTYSFQRDITEAVYDPITGTILAIDQQSHYVVRYDPIKRDFEDLISIEDMIVGGIAFDYIGNNIYLTNVKQQSIEVYSLTTREKTIFYTNGEAPGYIELVPEEGIMYVTCRANDSIRLYKMNMNGLQSIILGIVPDKPRIIMQYDSDAKELYTNFNLLPYTPTHSGLSLMHSLVPFMNNIVGQSMLRVISNTAVSLTVTKRSIFWTERNSRKLQWITKDTDAFFPFRSRFLLPLSIDEVETPFVISVRGIEKTSGKGCQENNGKCSHVCLPTSSESFICACPPKMELSANNRTCIAQSACPIGKIRCSEHAICINQEQRCDGHLDCPNGEDEYDCTSIKDTCNGNCSKNCTKGQHKCHDGKCIPQSFTCDGDYDCPDFSDELNCHNRTCALNEFMCETGKCIPEEFKCDGERDCPDGSDETRNCYIDNLCGPGYFSCTNNRCISALLKCNNVDDCGDDSDEKYCIENNIYRDCKKNEYACKNSYICVSEKARCDGKQDCPENDDEYQCLHCEEDEFKCHNRKKCIPMNWICDNTDDCGDNSDEIVCGPEPIKDNCQEFKCANNKCLPFSQVCDGHDDCLDGSDESGSCSTACKNHNCQNGCLRTPNGAICKCKTGYALFNGTHCKDINECEQNVCSQNCMNTVGSYQCLCRDGHVLRKSDKISCKAIGPPIRFITATRHDIRNISSNVRLIEVINQLSGISDISGIDSNALDDAIYWISDDEGTVNKINIKTQEILSMDNLTPTAISVDWITNNIYFNDNSHPNVIKVCNLEQRKCAVIKKMEGVERITALKVDPINRYLFWSQTSWYKTGPKAEIYRTNLLGTDMKKIVFRNVSFVSGMAIDYTRSRLYWLDSYLDTIQSSNLDGDKRTMFLSTEKQQATAINIFEDSLYWLSGPNGYLKICKLYGNNICKMIDLGANNVRKYFTIFHIGKHPVVENLCKKQHCDHMCILTSDGTACVCEDGKMGSDCLGNEISVASKRILLESPSESHPRHGGNVYGTVIVVILVVAVISGVYYYYQKYRYRFDSPNRDRFDHIHFQNPSFDRRDEVAVTLSSASSNIHPGQHEYMNPVNDKLLETAQESSLKRLKESTNQSEKNAKTEREASLINLQM